MRTDYKSLWCAAGIALLVSGCASTQKSTMYVLSPGCQPTASGKNLLPGKVVGIMRVSVPRRINRPVIVTQKNQYELDFSEFRRWGEMPDENLRNTIRRNLSQLLNSDSIIDSRVELPNRADYNINIDVIDMSGELGKNAHLAVNWDIAKGNESKSTVVYTSDFSEKLTDSEYITYVAAQSRMVDKLSRDIADALLKESK